MADAHNNDEEKFNEALKRMLKTPPKPKRSDDKGKSHDDKEKKPKD
jgi:hypothetical protein